MTIRKVQTYAITCDGCGEVEYLEGTDLPDGWTSETEIHEGTRSHQRRGWVTTKTVRHYCEECSD